MAAEPGPVARLTRIVGSAVEADTFDRVIPERVRLGLVSAPSVAPSMTFVIDTALAGRSS